MTSPLFRQTRAEILKTTSLRSTWAVALAGLAAGALLGTVQLGHAATLWATQPDSRPELNLATAPFNGVVLGQIAVAALGASVITAETGSRSLTSALLGCPRRGRLVLAKVLAALLLGVAWALVTVGILCALDALLLTEHGIAVPGRALVGIAVHTAGYLVVTSLLGLGLGLTLGSTAAALAVAVVLDFLLPILLRGGDVITQRIADAMPGTALMDLVRGDPLPATGTVIGLVVLPLALLLLGGTRVRRADVA